MNNKIVKLYKFLKANKHHSEARYLEKIAFAIPTSLLENLKNSGGITRAFESLNDILLESELDDALENIYREEIGISPSDAAKSRLSDYTLDFANYCGPESIEMAKYIMLHGIDENHSTMNDFSDQYNFKTREAKEDFLDNLMEDLGISSYDELRNKAKEEGYHIENTPLSNYLKEEFSMECGNYLAKRINLRNDIMKDHCEYVSKVYKALKQKEEGSKKIDLQISNVSNACKIYLNITLDDLDKNIDKYNYNDLSLALGCIIGEGSYLAYYEYPQDKIDYLEVNHPKILVKLEALRKKEESGYHKY